MMLYDRKETAQGGNSPWKSCYLTSAKGRWCSLLLFCHDRPIFFRNLLFQREPVQKIPDCFFPVGIRNAVISAVPAHKPISIFEFVYMLTSALRTFDFHEAALPVILYFCANLLSNVTGTTWYFSPNAVPPIVWYSVWCTRHSGSTRAPNCGFVSRL